MKHSQNASIIFVTQKGLGLLHQKRDTLIEELRLAQLHKGQAAGEDSNAWHDNAEYDFFAQKETRMAS